MIKFEFGGIDTVEGRTEGSLPKGTNNPMILLSKTTELKNETVMVLRPSNLKSGKELSTLNETVLAIEELEENTGKEIKLTRVDLSGDSLGKMIDNKNLIRMFLECLSFRRGYCGEIFRTTKGIEKDGNLKIRTGRKKTTFYDCLDKDRRANLRAENQITDIRSDKSNREILENEFKKYLQELKGLEVLIEKVEYKYIDELTGLYNKTIGKKYRTFSEFIAFVDSQGYVMTSHILKGLMKKVGIKTSYKNFTDSFKRTRKETLNFTTKTELKKMIKDLEKKLKIALKN